MFQIQTNRLVLRPLKIEDAESMFAYAKEPEIAKYTSWPAHQSVEDSIAFLQYILAQEKPTPLESLGVAFKESPEVIIGTISIKRRSHEFEGELAYALAPKYWQRGIMFEAGQALIEKAFDEYGYQRIFATCARENLASKNLMKKLGLSYEGCLKSRSFVKDRFWDVEYYALLKPEWDAACRIKNALENDS